ncbi:hypothetical protein A2U01_0067144, partial [Trifolium medium]|nr:hypothetical protein [Trifolium medium]
VNINDSWKWQPNPFEGYHLLSKKDQGVMQELHEVI